MADFRHIARRLVQIGLSDDGPPALPFDPEWSGRRSSSSTVTVTGDGAWHLLRYFMPDGSVAAWGARFYPAHSGRHSEEVR